jgi:hypothetical protein
LGNAALGIDTPEPLKVDNGPEGCDWFIAFEWNGGGVDFLNESTTGEALGRGANSTCSDAAIWFQNGGKAEVLLIEWKYTERYGAPIPAHGNATRIKRYKDLAFAPDGPIRADQELSLSHFFYERQRLLSAAACVGLGPRPDAASRRVAS